VAKGKGKEKPGSKVFPAESKKAEASKESKPAAKPKEKEQHEPKLRQKAEEKKKTGTLDWSKAAIKKEESKQTVRSFLFTNFLRSRLIGITY
jgi:hypothetical protein